MAETCQKCGRIVVVRMNARLCYWCWCFFFKCNCILTFLSISFCSFESFQNQRRSIIVAGACSENAIEYKKRLVFMEQIVPVIKYAMEQFPEHLGVQKQSLGLLHYLSGM